MNWPKSDGKKAEDMNSQSGFTFYNESFDSIEDIKDKVADHDLEFQQIRDLIIAGWIVIILTAIGVAISFLSLVVDVRTYIEKDEILISDEKKEIPVQNLKYSQTQKRTPISPFTPL